MKYKMIQKMSIYPYLNTLYITFGVSVLLLLSNTYPYYFIHIIIACVIILSTLIIYSAYKALTNIPRPIPILLGIIIGLIGLISPLYHVISFDISFSSLGTIQAKYIFNLIFVLLIFASFFTIYNISTTNNSTKLILKHYSIILFKTIGIILLLLWIFVKFNISSIQMQTLVEFINISFIIFTGILFVKSNNSSPSQLKTSVIIIFVYLSIIYIFYLYTRFNTSYLPLFYIMYVLMLYNIYNILSSLYTHYTYEDLSKYFNVSLQELSQMQSILTDNNFCIPFCSKNISLNSYSSKQLADFFQSATLIHKDYNIIYANEACLSLFNANNKKKLVGKHLSDLVALEDKRLIQLHKNLANRNTPNSPSIKIKVYTLDGKTKDVEYRSLTMRNNKKELYQILIIREVASAMELNFPNELSCSDVDSQMEFFANISHELKTPINVIYSSLQMQEFYINNNNLEKVESYTKMIRQNCLRLIRLINNTLDLKNITSNSLTPKLVVFDLVSAIEDMIGIIHSFITKKNLSIIFDTDVEEKIVKSDPILLQRIILNLISNAVKFNKDNGHIWINIYDYDDFVTIHIRDDGVGIPKHKQNSIFKEFSQIDPILTRRSEGSGIGLSLVLGLVKVLGGTISFTSQESVGSEFIITLNTPTVCEDNLHNLDWNTSFVPLDSIEMEFTDVY